MKTQLLAALFVLGLGSQALAETIDFPSDNPIASITFPDGWKAEETDTGVQGSSADDVATIYVDVTKIKDRQKAAEEAFKFLTDNGVTMNWDSEKKSQGAVNGMPASAYSFDGTEDGEPVAIGLAVFQANPEDGLIMTSWVRTGADYENHDGELSAITNSLKPVGQ